MKLYSLLETRDDDLKSASESWFALLKVKPQMDKDPIEVVHGEGRFAVCNWGIWEKSEQYYQLYHSSVEYLENTIKKMLERYPKLKFTFTTGEKNWIYFHIRTK